MQGTAADLIKLAMIAVQQALDAEGRATRMVMQVHDELVFEVPEAEVDWLREAVPRLMAGVASFSVPWWPRWASGRAGKRRTEPLLPAADRARRSIPRRPAGNRTPAVALSALPQRSIPRGLHQGR
jgi:hypothetical protein